MTRKQRRGVLIGTAVGVLSVAVFLVLFALKDTIVFFHTPKEVVERQIPAGKRIRLGGLVAKSSVKRGLGQTVEFAVTDTVQTIQVRYTGILPDLFREGQGVVTEGVLDTCRPLPRRHRARQARRELHAPRSRQVPQGARPLATRRERKGGRKKMIETLGPGAFRVASPLRGEGGAPSLSSALNELSACTTAELSDRGAPGGGDQFARSTFTPTRNAIGLSSPVVFDCRPAAGELSPWRSILPPQGGGNSDGVHP